MRKELEHIEWIERYLEGALLPDELLAFESRLKSDSDFAEEVELQRNVQQRLERLALLVLIDKQHKLFVKSGSSNGWWNLNTVLWVGGLLITLGLVSYLISNTVNQTEHVQTEKTDELVSQTTVLPVKYAVVNEGESIIVNTKQRNTLGYIPLRTPSAVDFVSFNPRALGEEKKKDEERKVDLKRFHVQWEVFEFNPADGLDQKTKSGTRIKIPEACMTGVIGENFNGSVYLFYREFRDAADMAFSGINMYHKNAQFDSYGMFEMSLSVDPTRPQSDFNYRNFDQPIEISFKDYDGNNSTGFYKYDHGWLLMDPNTGFDVNNNEFYRPYKIVQHENGVSEIISNLDDKNVLEEHYYVSNSKEALKEFRKDKNRERFENEKFYLKEPVQFRTGFLRAFQLGSPYSWRYNNWSGEIGNWRFMGNGYFVMKDLPSEIIHGSSQDIPALESETVDTLVVRNVADNSAVFQIQRLPDKTRSSRFKALLRVYGMGVYNCDNVESYNNEITVQPSFVDSSGGAINRPLNMITLIDPNLNGAYNIKREVFRCDAHAENKIVIYADGRIFGLAKPWSELGIRSSGKYSIEMVDITNKVYDIESLRRYLNNSPQ